MSNISKYHSSSISKSISKIFKPNFVCLLTNERYKTYQTGYSFGRLGHAPGVGLGGTVGGLVVQNFFFRNSTIFVVRVTYISGTCNGTFFWSQPPGALGRGHKVKYH